MRLTLLTLFLIISSLTWSQTCCSGGIPLSNNIGMSMYEKGTFQTGLSYDYNYLNTLNSGVKKLRGNNRLRVTHSVLLNVGYNITDKLLIESLFTWVNQRRNIKTSSTLDQASGFGDAIFLARYKLIESEKWQFSLGAGAKLPLGVTDRRSDLGILLNADLQPGSNAFDGIYIATLSRGFDFRRTLNVSLRATYRNTGTNTEYQKVNSYKFGNEIQSYLTISDQLLVFNEIISPSITIKYRKANADAINSNLISNTGGEWLFLTPSFSMYITPKMVFNSAAELPLYSNVTGTQLTPTFRLTTGVTFQISSSKTKNLKL